MGENPYEVGADGTPFVPVGAGGICYNVKVGMAAMGWAADQVEPGVSIANPDPGLERRAGRLRLRREPGDRPHRRCGGRRRHRDRKARVVPRLQARARPRRRRHLEQIAPGDELLVRACGRGMSVAGAPGIACHSLGPELWRAWAPAEADGRVSGRGHARSSRPRSSGWAAAASPPPRRSPSRPRTPTSCASTAGGSAAGRHRRCARLGRHALHGLSRRRRHRRRRRLRRQPAGRQRARGHRAPLGRRTDRSSPSSTPDANLATMLGLS